MGSIDHVVLTLDPPLHSVSTTTTSLLRQFPASVLSHEQRDECKQSSSALKEDNTCQLLTTLEGKKIEHAAYIQQQIGNSLQHQEEFKHQLCHWSSSSFLLSSLITEEHLTSKAVEEHKGLKSCDVISLAEEALLASKLAMS